MTYLGGEEKEHTENEEWRGGRKAAW